MSISQDGSRVWLKGLFSFCSPINTQKSELQQSAIWIEKVFCWRNVLFEIGIGIVTMQLQSGETPAEFTEDGVLIARGCDWNCEQRQLELQTGSVDVWRPNFDLPAKSNQLPDAKIECKSRRSTGGSGSGGDRGWWWSWWSHLAICTCLCRAL